MTDNEIIIDCVNVSGCRDYDAGECLSPCTTVRSCEAEKNCQYKQLKRLEAENAKLKEELKTETTQAQKWYQIETDKHFLALKYLNCLQEIKEIASNIQTDFTVKYDRKVNKAFTQILQKISECEV